MHGRVVDFRITIRSMTQRVEAIFEGGILRPLTRINGVAESARVVVTDECESMPPKSVFDCIGTLPDEDAAEMSAAIEEEFERIDPSEWQ